MTPEELAACRAGEAGENSTVGLGGWMSMETVPELGTECLVWLRYTLDGPGFPGIDTWDVQREDPLGMGGPTIETGVGWNDNDCNDVLYWIALPPPPDVGIDPRNAPPNLNSMTPDVADLSSKEGA